MWFTEKMDSGAQGLVQRFHALGQTIFGRLLDNFLGFQKLCPVKLWAMFSLSNKT